MQSGMRYSIYSTYRSLTFNPARISNPKIRTEVSGRWPSCLSRLSRSAPVQYSSINHKLLRVSYQS